MTDAIPFSDLTAFTKMPRLGGLTMSPDGKRLVTSVQTVDAKGTAYRTALWEIDPTGDASPRRLTRGFTSEGGAAFTSHGDLLFIARRPNDEGSDAPDTPALWILPSTGGEARVIARHPGGVASVHPATEGDTVAIVASSLPQSDSMDDDVESFKKRKDNKVQAVLHSTYPVRFWDHDLGPGTPRLFALDAAELSGDPVADDEVLPSLREIARVTPNTRGSVTPEISPDGSFAILTVARPLGRTETTNDLVRLDLATGESTVLLAGDAETSFHGPHISPDGTKLAFIESAQSTATTPPDHHLGVISFDEPGIITRLAADWDRWPGDVAWHPSGERLYVTANEAGHCPIFAIALADDTVTRLTDEGTYTDLNMAPDGTAIYALRASYLYPAEPVRVAIGEGPSSSSAEITQLPTPTPRPELPGRLEDFSIEASDGTTVRSYLLLPDGASAEKPAPLLLWIHGGPLMSWNAWSWRWNPWNMVAKGYAVALPDPALSTGYGLRMVERSWGDWGGAAYTDLMEVTDAVVARDDIDGERTAAMGGSFGGYMANWIAGHTDRFKAIVTHASLWNLESFGAMTDMSTYWAREMTPEMAAKNSPHRFVSEIVTPMMVIHGDKDYRVPIGEGLALWWALLAQSGLPQAEDGSTAHRFLYFPEENHWVLRPQNSVIWYEEIFKFLGEHVLGEDPLPPNELIG